MVIGQSARNVTRENWRECVFGYTILNDVSARDVQLATSQWTLGKSFPTFCPIGPWVVTADELTDPHSLDVTLTIGGETLQQANTRDLIFDIPAVLGYISAIVPLGTGRHRQHRHTAGRRVGPHTAAVDASGRRGRYRDQRYRAAREPYRGRRPELSCSTRRAG